MLPLPLLNLQPPTTTKKTKTKNKNKNKNKQTNKTKQKQLDQIKNQTIAQLNRNQTNRPMPIPMNHSITTPIPTAQPRWYPQTMLMPTNPRTTPIPTKQSNPHRYLQTTDGRGEKRENKNREVREERGPIIDFHEKGGNKKRIFMFTFML